MKIHAAFDKRVIVHSQEQPWLPSPMPGVFRRPLDRVGAEVARATSIVRYDPKSHFSPHVHTGGEEFLVLEGVFQDEHGEFPVGSYIRNPPQSKHKPGSEPGCVIFVKLWQFEPEDRTHVRLNTQFMEAIPHRDFPGIAVTPLFQDEIEKVSMLNLEPHAKLQWKAPGGAELLVLEGTLVEKGDLLKPYSWLRIPPHSHLDAQAAPNGARIWLKTGHLNRVTAEITRVSQKDG